MRNSQAPQSEEEDGWLSREGSADEKYLIAEDYLDEAPPQPRRGSVIPRRDDTKYTENLWQAAASASPNEGKDEKAAESRASPQDEEKEGADKRNLSAKETSIEETGEDIVTTEARHIKDSPSCALDEKASEEDTPYVTVNEPQLLSGEKGAECGTEEEQHSAADRKEDDSHAPSLPLSKAATMSAGGDRDQLVSAGGARSSFFLTDRDNKPLSSSPYPQRSSSNTPANEEDSTARRTGNACSSSPAKVALFDSLDNGPRIREGVDRLTNLLAGLDGKVEKLVGDHERDFLLAYRTHMYAIQQQMEYFKKKADEEQAKILRDMKVRSLEKELSWFMSEALRLDGLCKHYQGNLEKWRARAEALTEDRNFLETQIKSCKRQSRALQARVDDLQNGATDVGTLGRNTLKNAFAFDENCTTKRGTCYTQNKNGIDTTRYSLRRVAPRVPCANGSSDLSADILRSQNERLRSELDRAKKQHRQLLALQETQMLSTKGEYEDFFLKCCNEVRREIQNRRVRALRSSGSPTAICREENILDENFAREATLQDFLQADRRRLLELLVSSDQLLGHLHTLVFTRTGRGSPSQATHELSERHNTKPETEDFSYGRGDTVEARDGEIPRG